MAKMNRKLGYGKMSRQFVSASIQEIAEEEMERYSKLLYEGMKTPKIGVPTKTGALRDAVRMRKTNEQKYSVYVSSVQLSSDPRNKSHIDYSYIVWKGHKAYTIRAKGKPMVWVDEDGKKHGAWEVHIPEQPANDYVGRSVAYADSKF